MLCRDLAILDTVMKLYDEDALEKAAESMFGSHDNCTKFAASSLNVYVSTNCFQYHRCLQELQVFYKTQLGVSKLKNQAEI